MTLRVIHHSRIHLLRYFLWRRFLSSTKIRLVPPTRIQQDGFSILQARRGNIKM